MTWLVTESQYPILSPSYICFLSFNINALIEGTTTNIDDALTEVPLFDSLKFSQRMNIKLCFSYIYIYILKINRFLQKVNNSFI